MKLVNLVKLIKLMNLDVQAPLGAIPLCADDFSRLFHQFHHLYQLDQGWRLTSFSKYGNLGKILESGGEKGDE